MKKAIIFILTIVSLTIISCDNQNTVPEVLESDFHGTWILTSSVSERLMDYNNDNQYSNDLTNELGCFNLELTFNSDGTFTEVRIDKSNSNACIQIDLTGMWRLDSNKILMTYNNKNFDNQENDFDFINDRSFIIKRSFNDADGDFFVDLRMSHI